jgi:hypothetical protein
VIGPRTGVRCGLVAGSRVGSGVDELGGDSGFTTRDATANKGVPLAAAEYTAQGFAAPMSIWSMQDATGNPADSVGTVTLTATSPAGYRQAVAGWSRQAITFIATANQLFNNSAPTLPDTATTSQLILAYIAVTSAPGADAELVLGGGQNTRILVTSGNVMKVSNDAVNTITATGAANVGTVVRPYVLKIDVTGSAIRAYNDLEKLAPAFSASPSGTKVFFAAGIESSPASALLYAAMWKGAAAEMSDSTIRSLLTRLGWAVSW